MHRARGGHETLNPMAGGRNEVGNKPAESPVDLRTNSPMILAPRAGLEPAAYCLGGSRSIRLSYRGRAARFAVSYRETAREPTQA